MTYNEFLAAKQVQHQPCGFAVDHINDKLFDWQRAVCRWSLAQGKAALFEDCGLGKTAQQLVWADEVARQVHAPVIILAPLAVSTQTKREGRKFGVDVKLCETQADVVKGVNIINYEKLDRLDAKTFGGVVLDESSILKSYMGKLKRQIVDQFKDTPYRLACSATPAPNDLMELLNHAEFLGIMKSSEALSVWFIADQTNSGTYKLKGHAERDFWRWVSSWAVCIEKPSDIGFSDAGYLLPPLTERDEIIKVDELNEDVTQGLLRDIDMSATGFFREKSRTVKDRARRCAELATSTQDQYLLWCYTNEESDELARLLPEALAVRGSDKASAKEQAAMCFVDGGARILISKPSIFGYGLNFQNCHKAIFCGLDYSYESYYQAVRRLYRFGQASPVEVSRVLGSTEQNILSVIERKQQQKNNMARSMAGFMRELQTQSLKGSYYQLDLTQHSYTTPHWLRSESA